MVATEVETAGKDTPFAERKATLNPIVRALLTAGHRGDVGELADVVASRHRESDLPAVCALIENGWLPADSSEQADYLNCIRATLTSIRSLNLSEVEHAQVLAGIRAGQLRVKDIYWGEVVKFLAGRVAERPRPPAPRRGVQRNGPCVHLGPPVLVDGQQELRDCKTCKGNVRQKVFSCGIHGECTLKDCKTCRDYHPIPDETGGHGPGNHAVDHFGLAVSKGATMSLYYANGRADRSLAGCLEGATLFFLGGGPSLGDLDLSRLEGLPTIAVNGVCELYGAPTVWMGVDAPDDPPDRFRGVPWGDPDVLKLLPRAWAGAKVGGIPVFQHPGVRFFLRNGCFAPWRFLTERSINWGGEDPYGAGRSVMLPALRIARYFGVKRVVLLGCDFRMSPDYGYCHSGPVDAKKSATVNDNFRILDARFGRLRPYLEAAGMAVVNATRDSILTAFERSTFAEEVARCCS